MRKWNELMMAIALLAGQAIIVDKAQADGAQSSTVPGQKMAFMSLAKPALKCARSPICRLWIGRRLRELSLDYALGIVESLMDDMREQKRPHNDELQRHRLKRLEVLLQKAQPSKADRNEMKLLIKLMQDDNRART